MVCHRKAGPPANGLPETATITPRGWLQSVNVGTSGSVYSLSIASYAPNGDILQANDNVNGNWTYAYDDFNRLLTSNKNSNQNAFSYVYDRFGNRWQQNVTAGTGPNPSYAFDTNNRITTTGVTYDSAGNARNDGTHAYIYDAENRIIQVDGTAGQCSSATACYVYDAEGRRVRKTTGSVSVDYVYDLGGNVVAEVSSTGGWNRGEVFAGAHHLATYSGGTGGNTYFIHADHLGSERVRTNVSGVAVETCTNLPFGDLQTCTGTDVSPLHFTGKQRDTETGNDDFGARYLNSGMARWLTPDWSARQQAVPYADPGNPQTLNLYAYILNNPTSHVDSDGHFGGKDACKTPGCAQPEEAGGAANKADPGMSDQYDAQQAEKRRETQNNDPSQKAATVFGETSGLKPEAGKDGKADPNSAKQLKDARENIADVSERNKTVYSHTPTAKELKNPEVRKAWEESKEAARASDGSKPGKYFFIRQEGVGKQRPKAGAGFGQGDPIHEYGPFRNAGGGDVPKGNQTYVDIYNQ